ncbi:hypothetical protein D3C83_211160 [compost metagenome]
MASGSDHLIRKGVISGLAGGASAGFVYAALVPGIAYTQGVVVGAIGGAVAALVLRLLSR